MQTVIRISACAVFFLCAILCSCSHAPVYDDAQVRKYNSTADSMYLNGHMPEAIKLLDSLFGQPQGSLLGKYFLFARKEQYDLERKNFAKAMLYNDSSLALIEQNKLQQKYTREYIHSLLVKGLIFSTAEKFDSAYNAYMEGYKFVLKAGDPCLQHEFDYFIGMSLFKLNNRVQARDFFKRSFIGACNCEGENKPWYRMQEILDNIALCYKGEPEELIYYDSCISFINHNSDKFQTKEMVANALSTCYRNKGFRYLMRNQMQEGKQCLLNAIDVYKTLDSNKYRTEIINRKLGLAISLYMAEDSAAVVAMWQQLKPIADTIKADQTQQQWLRLNFMYYQVKKDYENAFWALSDFVNFQDTTRYLSADTSKKDITQDITNLEQGYKIQLLTKEKQLQRVYLWIAIGLSCLAAVIIMLVYKGYKRTRKANEVIGSQKVALETSNREKDRILHIVAHDLRNPIGGIAFISEMMLEEQELSMADAKESFDMIKTSSERSLHLVDELLVVAKNDQRILKKENTDLCALARQCIADLKYKADEKNQTLACHTPGEAVVLNIDKEKIEQVLGNLITNAIKFSRENGAISLTVSATKNSVVLAVMDNGIGIPPKLIPGLFELFTESRRPGTANEKTYGLGLSICKQTVEEHGGILTVTSIEGEGSTFTIELPA